MSNFAWRLVHFKSGSLVRVVIDVLRQIKERLRTVVSIENARKRTFAHFLNGSAGVAEKIVDHSKAVQIIPSRTV
jgi:hypothetical protein